MDIFISAAFRLEVKVFFAFLLLLFSSSQSFAHCAMCKSTIEQANTLNSTSYLALAALFLFLPALILFFVMLLVIYKYR